MIPALDFWMTPEPPTQLIERSELLLLVEASRDDSSRPHTVHRPRAKAAPARATNPSAMRGLVWLVAGAWLARELIHFFV